MGRKPCCSKVGMKRGAWTPAEDKILTDYIKLHGEGKWRNLAQNAGLNRCGKSCRLRWINYLKPGIKRGNITVDEEELIIRLHKLLGNRWSLIAGRLPGRTDNEIKNYWNTILARKVHGHGHVASSSSTRKPSKRSDEIHKREESMPLKEEKLEVKPAAPTKAMKVSKAFNLMSNNAHQKGMTETKENNGKEHENSVIKESFVLNYENELVGQDQLLSSSTTAEENDPSNFTRVDYTWGDLNFLDLLNSSEFSDSCGLTSHENGINMDMQRMDVTYSATPDEPLVFCDDTLENSTITPEPYFNWELLLIPDANF